MRDRKKIEVNIEDYERTLSELDTPLAQQITDLDAALGGHKKALGSLNDAGIYCFEHLAGRSEADLLQLKWVGKAAILALRENGMRLNAANPRAPASSPTPEPGMDRARLAESILFALIHRDKQVSARALVGEAFDAAEAFLERLGS